MEEIVDQRYKSWFGDQFDLDWMKEARHPCLAQEGRGGLLALLRQDPDPHLLRAFSHVQGDARGHPAGDRPLPGSRSGRLPAHARLAPLRRLIHETRPEFDLTAIYFRLPFQSFTMTGNNAWLDEVATIDPYANELNINAATAARKGIKDGDWIELESAPTARRCGVEPG